MKIATHLAAAALLGLIAALLLGDSTRTCTPDKVGDVQESVSVTTSCDDGGHFSGHALLFGGACSAVLQADGGAPLGIPLSGSLDQGSISLFGSPDNGDGGGMCCTGPFTNGQPVTLTCTDTCGDAGISHCQSTLRP